MHLKSEWIEKIAGVSHGFGSLSEPLPRQFAENWNEQKARWKQVHGAQCAELLVPAQECGEADALFSFTPELPVAIVTADCVPVLLARKDGRGVAAVHAGWRGTRARILRSLWQQLSQRGEKPSEWVAAVGPAIGPCCYEVSESLAEEFGKEFSPLAVPGFRRLDLPAVNAEELRQLGVSQVDLIRACTRCSLDDRGQSLYHSYRREGAGVRQYSVIASRRA